MFVFQILVKKDELTSYAKPVLAHFEKYYGIKTPQDIQRLEKLIDIAFGGSSQGEEFLFSTKLTANEIGNFKKFKDELNSNKKFISTIRSEFADVTGEKPNSGKVNALTEGQIEFIAFILAVKSKGAIDVKDAPEFTVDATTITICTSSCIHLDLLALRDNPQKFEKLAEDYKRFASLGHASQKSEMQKRFGEEAWDTMAGLASKIAEVLSGQTGQNIFTGKSSFFGATYLLNEDVERKKDIENIRDNLAFAHEEIEKEKKRKRGKAS